MASSQVNPLKRKHTALTLETKLKLLSEIDNMGKTTTKKEIADSYRIPANTLSTILKNREKIEKNGQLILCQFEQETDANKSSGGRRCWFADLVQAIKKISGPIVMEEAGELAQELGIDFVPCPGWVGRFKRRHGSFSRLSVEKRHLWT